jgi:hypothetical protein
VSTSGREDDRFLAWLERIESEGRNLSTWEEEFVASIRERFDRGWSTLTERQAEILERIYAEKTP